ncbi:hypothetical protein RugamoR64_42020 [Duganella rhizosphaerae]|uniref:FlxA-like family protein n=1 Tax=Duganella rhizosphaerae TaxID=2885763 RepID=UPI0030EA252E
MNTSTVSPVQPATAATETTTVRSAIIKQIRVLQKQEAKLGEELAKLAGDTSTDSIQQRIALMQQIQSLEDQIKALETALLQKDADRQITVAKTDESPPPAPAGDKVGTIIDTVA